jgi:twitching motility two-component system response regulator PilH
MVDGQALQHAYAWWMQDGTADGLRQWLQAAQRRHIVQGESLGGRAMAGKRILVVEDDPRQRRWITSHLSGLLRERPYLFEATDGRQGIALALHERPDLIVLDDSLPTLRGGKVCHELKKDPETAAIKVVLLTVQDTLVGRFSADACLGKPYDAYELVRTVERLLGP